MLTADAHRGRAGRLFLAVAAAVAAIHLGDNHAGAADGVFTNTSGGTWSTTSNWLGGTASNIADGAGSNADFSTINITANRTATLNTVSRTAGVIRFGDTTASHNWTLAANAGLSLTLDNGLALPEFVVDNQTVTVTAPVLGSAGFVKYNGGTAAFRNIASLSGPVIALGGTTRLEGADGTFASTITSLTLSGGTFQLDNNIVANNVTDRIADTVPVRLHNGTFSLIAGTAADASETIGSLTARGGSIVRADRQSATPMRAGLTFTTLTRESLATINFAVNDGVLGGAGAADPRIFIGNQLDTAGAIMGPWAVVNNSDFAVYSTTDGVAALGGTRQADINAATAADHVLLTAGATLTAARAVNTLVASTGDHSLDLGGNKLSVAGGGIIRPVLPLGAAATTTYTFAGGAGSGITAPGGTLYLYNADETNNTNAVVFNVPVEDDGATPVTFVKSGNGDVTFGVANTYTGSTIVSGGGTLKLDAGAATLAGTDSLVLEGGTVAFRAAAGTNFGENITLNRDSNLTAGRIVAGGSLTHTVGTLTVNNPSGLPWVTLTHNAGENMNTNTSGSLTFSGLVTLNGNLVVNANAVNGSSTPSLTLTAGLTDGAGSFYLAKRGNSNLIINANSTYDGGTTIYDGTLGVGNNTTSALGSGLIVLRDENDANNDPKLQITDTDGGTTISNPILARASVRNNGDVTLSASNTSGVNTFASVITADRNIRLEQTSSGDIVEFTNDITGVGNVTKIGSGVVNLTTTPKTYTGSTSVTAGVVNANVARSFGSPTGGNVSINGSTVNATVTNSLEGKAVTVTGGTLNVSPAAGLTGVAAAIGTVRIAAGGDLGTIPVSLTAGTLNFDAGTGNTVAYGGASVPVTSQGLVRVTSGVADLSTTSIQVTPLASTTGNQLLGRIYLSTNGLDNAAEVNSFLNTKPAATAAVTGALDIPDDNAFTALFGGVPGGSNFVALFTADFHPQVAGTNDYRFAIQDNDDAAIIYVDVGRDGFDDGDRIIRDSNLNDADQGGVASLVGGQSYPILYGVEDTGGGSLLQGNFNEPAGGTITASTRVNPTNALQAGMFTATVTTGGGSLQIDAGAELRIAAVSNATEILFPSGTGAGTLKLLGTGGNNASSTDLLRMTGAGPDAAVLEITAGHTLSASAVDIATGQTLSKTGGGILNILGSAPGGAGAGLLAISQGTLGGNGSIAGPISVASGATVAPGTSPGILGVAGADFADGSNLLIELNGLTVGTQYDQLNVTGGVDLGAVGTGPNLVLSLGFTPDLGDSFTIVNNDGVDPVVGVFAQGAVVSSGAFQFEIDYAGGTDNNDIVLTTVAVPEPTGLAVLGVAAIGLLRRRRR